MCRSMEARLTMDFHSRAEQIGCIFSQRLLNPPHAHLPEHFRNIGLRDVEGAGNHSLRKLRLRFVEQHNSGLYALRLAVGTPDSHSPIRSGMFEIPAIRF